MLEFNCKKLSETDGLPSQAPRCSPRASPTAVTAHFCLLYSVGFEEVAQRVALLTVEREKGLIVQEIDTADGKQN